MRKITYDQMTKLNLAEVGQTYKTTFAFVKEEGDLVHILHTPVLCRDFLNDTLVWATTPEQERRHIYGYFYAGEGQENLAMVMQFRSKVSKKTLLGNLHLIHALEDSLGIARTYVEELEGDHEPLLVVSAPDWRKTTIQWSLWTGLLRYLSVEKMESLEDIPNLEAKDSGLMAFKKHTVVGLIQRAFANVLGDKGVRGAATSYMHNYNGFVSWSVQHQSAYAF